MLAPVGEMPASWVLNGQMLVTDDDTNIVSPGKHFDVYPISKKVNLLLPWAFLAFGIARLACKHCFAQLSVAQVSRVPRGARNGDLMEIAQRELVEKTGCLELRLAGRDCRCHLANMVRITLVQRTLWDRIVNEAWPAEQLGCWIHAERSISELVVAEAFD